MAAPTLSGLYHLKISVADLERNATSLNVPATRSHSNCAGLRSPPAPSSCS
jgi:hypothetical protein